MLLSALLASVHLIFYAQFRFICHIFITLCILPITKCGAYDDCITLCKYAVHCIGGRGGGVDEKN